MLDRLYVGVALAKALLMMDETPAFAKLSYIGAEHTIVTDGDQVDVIVRSMLLP